MATNYTQIATNNNPLLYKELSYNVVKCLYNVRNKYGLHHNEYEVAYLSNFKEPNFRPKRFIHIIDRKSFLKLSAN